MVGILDELGGDKVEPEKKRRGRPRVHASDAERQKAFRERKGLVRFTVDLPEDVVQGISDYMKFKNLTKTQVIEKLVRSQLLRKR